MSAIREALSAQLISEMACNAAVCAAFGVKKEELYSAFQVICALDSAGYRCEPRYEYLGMTVPAFLECVPQNKDLVFSTADHIMGRCQGRICDIGRERTRRNHRIAAVWFIY